MPGPKFCQSLAAGHSRAFLAQSRQLVLGRSGHIRIAQPKRTQCLDWMEIEGFSVNGPAPKTVRHRFFVGLGHAIHLAWPVLSIILAIQIALGLVIGFVEGWSVGDAIYFTFVTGLTIGYGDIVPRQALGRALAVGIGICGLFLTGLIAGIAVYAMRTALAERENG